MTDGKVRLQKFLAECGVASRRKSEELIEDGKVTVEAGKETITFEKSEVALVRLRVEF